MVGPVYHSFLRIVALTFAVVLLFDSGLLNPATSELSNNTQLYLASAVGVRASVEPTELNTLTAQITSRERDLDAREAALTQREISVGLGGDLLSGKTNYSTYILSVILFILVVLIVLNYALDFARERRLVTRPQDNEQAA